MLGLEQARIIPILLWRLLAALRIEEDEEP
jgi:hypothetical protein